jgi:Zn-dependent protease with chaperone function
MHRTRIRVNVVAPILIVILFGALESARCYASQEPPPAARQDDDAPTKNEAAGSPAPPPEDLAARMADPAFLARARAYTRGNYVLFLLDNALTVAFLALITFTGLSSRAWAWIKERTGEGARGTILYIALFVVAASIVSLPLDYYDGFVREHAYGFSTQSPHGWFADRIKTLLLTIAIAALFLVPLYAFIRAFRRSWWMMGAALASAFAIFLTAIAPVFIDPIFNKFTPLPDQDLKRTILDMAHRNGIAADDVFEMDASTRSVHDNAYVTGVLGTERIVLYDVLLQSYTPDEVAYVMGHEMGHYVLHHLWKGLALAVALIVSGFYFVDRSMRYAVARWSARTGLTTVGEIATLPLLLLIVTAFMFVTLPIQSAYSRHLESAADQFGLRTVAHPEAAPDSFRKMAARNLSDPDPPALIEWFLYSHPSIGKRIRSAEAYLAARQRAAPAGATPGG